MKFKIGFKCYEEEKKEDLQVAKIHESKPVKSVVQVRFPSKGRSLAYYNDKFDLRVGDIVFVDGKLEGFQGIVTEVSRSFKIKLSDYKRIIAVADPQLFSQPQRKQRIKATPQNPNRAIPRINSALKIMLTRMISTMITMMISMITRTRRIITMSIMIEEV